MKILVILTFLATSCMTAFAACPSIPAAPGTLFISAAQYAASENFSLDQNGIIVYDYGKQYGGIGKYHNAFFVANYAAALYRDYLKTKCADQDLKDQFLKQADFLVHSGTNRNGALVWTFPFPVPALYMKPGWISGIGQSGIAGVLLRAAAITGDERYAKAAQQAMKVYEMSVSDGGVIVNDGDVTWIEEYASPDTPPETVLNGHITGLQGVLDYYRITGDAKWKALFDRGVEAVKRNIQKFDAGYLSWYTLSSPGLRILAPRCAYYNSQHVSQLLWLYDNVGDPTFLEWASRFEAYEIGGYSYSAKHSTDPKNNGPDQVAGCFGDAYWSDNQFPASIEVTTAQEHLFKGIMIQGDSDKAMARDFSVAARDGDKWQTIAEVENNTDIRKQIDFTYNVKTDAFRIRIANDNGNHNVALQAVMPIRTNPQYAAVTNYCNYQISKTRNNAAAAFDSESGGMYAYCPGWIIFPEDKQVAMTISATASPNAEFTIAYSDNLEKWVEGGQVPASAKSQSVPLAAALFVRLSFGRDISEINSIHLSK